MRSNGRVMVRACCVMAAFAWRAPAICQEKFEPIPQPQASRYRFDFGGNFFKSAEEQKAERVKLEAIVTSLEHMKGRVTESPGALLATLQLADRVNSQFMRHYIYLYLRYAVNT